MQPVQHVKIIAEAGVNHNGVLDNAMTLVDVAIDAGADAVKFQLFEADKLVKKNTPMANYQQENTNRQDSQYDLLKQLELSRADFIAIGQYCKKRGIELIVTPFDEDSVDFLAKELKVNIIKVSSGDLNNAPLLLKIAQTGLPVILSTGMACLNEVQQALGALAFGYFNHSDSPSSSSFALAFCAYREHLQDKVTLLHCTSEYPAPCDAINLNAIHTLYENFNVPVGFSDHSAGIHIPIAAVSLSVCMIEKHFTLDKNMPGPDHKASLDPVELKDMVRSIRDVSKAMGDGKKVLMPCEMDNRLKVRKSIVARQPIRAGESFTEKNLTIMRPGEGMAPVNYWDLLGRTAQQDYANGENIQ